ncbi:unnamed protein product [Tuber melanosporum]|uniref:(Perigord truffle) hypothetical protein n=1 Tax=Tuber melanosporum (strain Mel28) TaxID=656061 RepID=D5GBF7_TUBMM|nr:uncharacterized protein GSTUM_00000450001 [Tuber melanosporum]CAZ81850.1 unnamed protein product [Tuber melanosporum]
MIETDPSKYYIHSGILSQQCETENRGQYLIGPR